MAKKDEVNIAKETLAGISHDIRAPLAGVVMALRRYMNSSSTYSGPEVYELVGASERSITRVLGVIDYLIAQERLSNSTLSLAREDVLIRPLVDDILGEILPISSIKGVRLINEVAMDSRLNVDRMLFTRLLSNLVVNSIKFSKNGDYVSVSIEDGKLKVADTGIGLNADGLIHNNSSQSKSTAGEDGLGMGLMICRKIAKAHGGGIELRRRDGGGTIAVVTFGGASYRVMVIGGDQLFDDEIGRLLNANIDLAGLISVTKIADAMLAMEYVYSTPPNIILLYIEDKWEESMDFVRRIRDSGRAVTTAIIVVTRTAADENIKWVYKEAIAAGADDLISVPFAAKDLLVKIETYLSGHWLDER